jgi:hypothetical protein
MTVVLQDGPVRIGIFKVGEIDEKGAAIGTALPTLYDVASSAALQQILNANKGNERERE